MTTKEEYQLDPNCLATPNLPRGKEIMKNYQDILIPIVIVAGIVLVVALWSGLLGLNPQVGSSGTSASSNIASSTPTLLDPPVPTQTIVFQAVVIEEAFCFLGNSNLKATIPQFFIVGVVAIDNTGNWFLVRVNGLPSDCWVQSSTLNLSNAPLYSLTPIPNWSTPSLNGSPVSETEEPAIDVGISTLEVEILTSIEYCPCDGAGTASITILFKNGTPPYQVGNQGLVTGDRVTFPLDLGSKASLTITSSDGRKWEGTITAPGQCSPPPNSCSEPNPQPPKVPNPQPTTIPPTQPPPTQPPPPTIPPLICQIAPWLCD